MQFTAALLASSLAMMASAVPMHEHKHAHLHQRQASGQTFPIKITNNCGSTKSFALYSIDVADWTVNQESAPRSIPNGETHTINAPFDGIGLRLSGNADWPIGNQWNPQALVEFGYSTYGGQTGTAYDLSLMSGCDPSIGVSVTPDNSACEAKSCTDPLSCALTQAWTNPDQNEQGSPADTVCYQGLTGFSVVWCPSASGSTPASPASAAPSSSPTWL